MRVLFISPRCSWPLISGARLRDYHLARALSERAELTYVYFADSNPLQQHLPAAKSVIAVATPLKYTAGKIARGLVSQYPLPVQNYTSPEMAAVIKWQLKNRPFDIVHLDSIHLAGYMPVIRRHAPGAKIALDWHNIESELMQRYAKSNSGARKLYAALTVKRLVALEEEMLQDCFGHVVCSRREQCELLARQQSARIVTVENGVDTGHFYPARTADAKKQLVFVGQMSYHANVEGIIWFVREFWDAIRKRFPELKLTIVGSDPAPSVLALQQPGAIEVTGTVPDVLPYYQNAFASIVPLQTGGGTRLKILEAMAAGAAVVSTALGAEGLNVVPGAHFLSAEATVESWMRALDVLADADRRQTITAAARELVCREYDWAALGARLAQTYEEWSSLP